MKPAKGKPILPLIRVIVLLAAVVAVAILILFYAEMIVTWLHGVTLSMPLAVLISLTTLVTYSGCIILIMSYCGDSPASTPAGL